jgi:stage V sporulation protein G
MIRITEVRIHLLEDSQSKLKAYANITFDDCFVIHGIKVIEGDRGLFIGMPRRKKQDGPHRISRTPINKETREFIEARIIEAYHHAMENPETSVE